VRKMISYSLNEAVLPVCTKFYGASASSMTEYGRWTFSSATLNFNGSRMAYIYMMYRTNLECKNKSHALVLVARRRGITAEEKRVTKKLKFFILFLIDHFFNYCNYKKMNSAGI
jgi:hypothetical protein